MDRCRRKILKNITLAAIAGGIGIVSNESTLRVASAATRNAPGYEVPSRFLEVLGSKMHYVEMGQGDPIVLLHGNPTSSYLWRNIAPRIAGLGRVIVPDMIGMGLSDKPDIGYRFDDHIAYLEAFFEKLRLNNILFVGHDWGSAIAFDYSMRNESRVKGIAFMEGFVRPLSWDDWPESARDLFKKIRTRDEGWDLIVNKNVFIEGILPFATVRQYTQEEMDNYRAPFLNVASRKPMWVWPNELPLGGEPADVVARVERYSAWLQRSAIPKLLLYAEPGAVLQAPVVRWCVNHLPNLQIASIGKGIHYIQEDNPAAISFLLGNWIRQIENKEVK
jgi:haloalkane dehalogenase